MLRLRPVPVAPAVELSAAGVGSGTLAVSGLDPVALCEGRVVVGSKAIMVRDRRYLHRFADCDF